MGGFGDLDEAGGIVPGIIDTAHVVADVGDGGSDAIEVGGFEGGGAADAGMVEVEAVLEGIEICQAGLLFSFLGYRVAGCWT